MSKPLVDLIPYKKAIILFGFVKTNISSVCMGTGVATIVSTLLTKSIFAEFRYYGLILGVGVVLIGEIATIAIDYWKIKDKEKELKTIEEHNAEKLAERTKEIEEYAERIAEEKILKAMDELKKGDKEN